MGCRIMHDLTEGGLSCFYDSTTMTAFGPVFSGIEEHPTLSEAREEAEAFLGWCLGDDYAAQEGFIDEHTPYKDPRAFALPEIERLHDEWFARQRVAAGLSNEVIR